MFFFPPPVPARRIPASFVRSTQPGLLNKANVDNSAASLLTCWPSWIKRMMLSGVCCGCFWWLLPVLLVGEVLVTAEATCFIFWPSTLWSAVIQVCFRQSFFSSFLFFLKKGWSFSMFFDGWFFFIYLLNSTQHSAVVNNAVTLL